MTRRSTATLADMLTKCMSADPTYLLGFSSGFTQFRLPEVHSVMSMLGVDPVWSPPADHTPFSEVAFSSEADARAVTERTVSVKWCMELWAVADSLEELHKQVKDRLCHRPETVTPHCAADTFCFNVESRTRTLARADKLALIDSFSYLPTKGKVRLEGADLQLQLVLDYGASTGRLADRLEKVYFGRWLCAGPRSTITRHSLKTRAYIGNTSMAPEFALMMANLARVRRGDLVLDPFCGTGSLLVAAAHWGGYVLGTDIDYLTVHARTRPSRVQERGKARGHSESIAANLAQYDLQSQMVDVLVADSALTQMWHRRLTVDAIVTDPPYGIRERTRRLQGGGDAARPRAAVCCAGQLFGDLLQLAADRLPVGGRLVFWLPVMRAEYSEETLPSHPCLQLVANCEQVLTTHCSRRLLTLEKWREPTSDGCGAVVHDSMARFKESYFSAVHPEATLNGDLSAVESTEEANGDAS